MIEERDPLIALDFDAAVLRHVLHQDQAAPLVSSSGRPLIVPDWNPYNVFH